MPAKKEKEDEEVVQELNIFESELVPKQEVMPDDEKLALLQELGITEHQLPRMRSTDPAAKALGAKKGDVIRITRDSPAAGEHYYYRVVV